MEKLDPTRQELLNTTFTKTEANKMKHGSCWRVGTNVIYFLKSKGVINTHFKVAVTGTEGTKELGHGVERNNSVEHYQ